MNKTIILPIISAAALILKNVFGLPIGDDLINSISDLILGAITVYGIFKNHKGSGGSGSGGSGSGGGGGGAGGPTIP